MADNVSISTGADASVATDDVGGAHYQKVKLADGTADSSTAVAAGGGVEANALRVTIASDSTGVVSVDDNGSTLSVDDGGSTLSIDDGGGAITVDGTVTATPTGTYTTKETRAATSAVTSVGDSASSVTLLSANANRLGASITNTSSAILYVKFGTTATSSDYTVRMVQNAYYEVPFNYTGRIDGIWASDAGGAALCTELSA